MQNCAGGSNPTLRIGGDEFLIICPRTNAVTAQMLMRDIEQGLKVASDEDLTLGASMGSATIASANEPFGEAFKAADAAMYEQKQAHHRG